MSVFIHHYFFSECASSSAVSLSLSLSFPGSHCTSLHTIELFNCNRVTDEGMIALAAGCSALRSVDLMCCDIQLVTRR